jgi:hypothetical protein
MISVAGAPGWFERLQRYEVRQPCWFWHRLCHQSVDWSRIIRLWNSMITIAVVKEIVESVDYLAHFTMANWSVTKSS